MRIYIAAPYAVRNELRVPAQELREAGHEPTATWLNAAHEITPGTLETAADFSDEYAEEHSIQDLEDVARSDLVIAVTWATAESLVFPGTSLGGNSGGRHVETGAALALSIPVLVWGQPENIFHRGLCRAVDTWEDVLAEVGAIHNERMGISQP